MDKVAERDNKSTADVENGERQVYAGCTTTQRAASTPPATASNQYFDKILIASQGRRVVRLARTPHGRDG